MTARPRILIGLAWVGVVLSLGLLGAAVWFHLAFDPIIRIPFVVVAATGGLLIGLSCVGYINSGRIK